MLLTEIPRSTLGIQLSDPEIQVLAEKCQQLLGYSVLAEANKNIESTMGPLAKALADLEIEILDYASVKRYQLERVHESEQAELAQEFQVASEYQWNSLPNASWDSTEIEKYKEPIPEFVLNKALQIKQAFPGAAICIEHFSATRDPFLVVKRMEGDYRAKELYYVEVWEEPKFEGRLDR